MTRAGIDITCRKSSERPGTDHPGIYRTRAKGRVPDQGKGTVSDKSLGAAGDRVPVLYREQGFGDPSFSERPGTEYRGYIGNKDFGHRLKMAKSRPWAPRSPRSTFGKIFLLIFSLNWTILRPLATTFFFFFWSPKSENIDLGGPPLTRPNISNLSFCQNKV